MKAILKSIEPKQCLNIMNHKQSILVIRDKRTATAIQKLIDENEYADICGYCSKINRKHHHLLEVIDTDTGKKEYEIDYFIGSSEDYDYCYEGKVAFKFRCYKTEKIVKRHVFDAPFLSEFIYQGNENRFSFERKTGLDEEQLCEYSKNKDIYAIHISNLEIFDRPKELSEFYKANEQMEYIKSLWNDGGLPDKDDYDEVILTKAPQNFCYVEVEECKD